MRTSRTSRWLLASTLAALAFAIPPWSAAQDAVASDDPGTYGRVRYADRGLTIERSSGVEDPDGATITNAPVFPGDTVRTDRSQRVELELASGTLVRVAESTEMTFLALPDPYAEVPDHTVLQLHRGTVRLAGRLADNQELRIDTPAASIYSLGGGDLRIDVDPDGTTVVAAVRGVAEVAGSGGSVIVRGGMRTEVRVDDYPADPAAFHTFAQDGFDRWVADRDQAFATRDRYDDGSNDDAAYDELPGEVRPYYRELSAHGRWVQTDDYGYAWYPSGVSDGWRPYYDGYWSYGPTGYFWVSSEPWGWAPYHYGRWTWYDPYGWCWIPGRVFAGAWVAWSWGAVHIGWAPLGYWNQPVYVHNAYYGYYDPGCWTFVSYGHFHGHGSYRGHAVPYRDVDVQSHVVAARPPSARPDRLAGSVDARREAAREARLGSTPRVTAIDRTTRPSESMRDVERRQAASRGRGGSPTRASASPSRSLDPLESGRGLAPRFPRQLTDSRNRTAAPSAGRGTSSAAAGERDGSADADRRVRELYRRMASPRTTRDAQGAGQEPPEPSARSRDPRTVRPSAPQASPRPRSTASGTDRGKAAARGTGASSAPRREEPAATPRPTAAPERGYVRRTSPAAAAPRREETRAAPRTTPPRAATAERSGATRAPAAAPSRPTGEPRRPAPSAASAPRREETRAAPRTTPPRAATAPRSGATRAPAAAPSRPTGEPRRSTGAAPAPKPDRSGGGSARPSRSDAPARGRAKDGRKE